MRAARIAPVTLLLLGALAPGAVPQATLKVPKDFPSIAEALAQAQPGDTVLLAKGTYTENVLVELDGLTLQGKGAVVDARGGTGLRVEADDVTLTGLEVVNALDGIVMAGDRASVLRCRVTGAAGRGIAVAGDEALLERNTVQQCGLAGMQLLAASPQGTSRLERNTVRLNGEVGIEIAAAQVLVQKNTVEHNAGHGIAFDTAFAPEAPGALVFNTVSGNGGDGINVFTAPAGLVVGGNRLQHNGGAGLQVESGSNLMVLENTVRQNGGPGLRLGSDSSTVGANKVLENGAAGILLDEGFLGGHTVSDNLCRGNGRDGIALLGPANSVDGNRCLANLGDGIDVDVALGGTSLTGNTCRKNRHEGIDNSGILTVLVDNVCLKNGSKASQEGVADVPDLAGAGNDGRGSVDPGASSGNVFGSGDVDVSQVMDL